LQATPYATQLSCTAPYSEMVFFARYIRLLGDVTRGLMADAEVRLIESPVGRFFRIDGSGHVSKHPYRHPPIHTSPESCPRFVFQVSWCFPDEALARGNLVYLLTVPQPNQIDNTTFIKEIRAGLTTFATMAYIIAVNVSSL
jgi:hypothetical protein